MKVCLDIDTVNCADLAQKLSFLRKDMVLILAGEMSIEYVGRASSYAPSGSRLLILKPDGSLLVHEQLRVEPLNWQPPRSTAHFECYNDKLRIRSVRENPREEVLIEFNDIEFVKACRLVHTKLAVIGRESDIVKMLLANPSIVEENATIVGVDVATPYGKVDILMKKDDKLIVVEVKNEKAGITAVAQLKRYVEFYTSRGCRVEGVLVAPDISSDAMAMLIKEGFKFVNTNTLRRSTLADKTLEKFFKTKRVEVSGG
jgi:RecB family endonuclease NucS